MDHRRDAPSETPDRRFEFPGCPGGFPSSELGLTAKEWALMFFSTWNLRSGYLRMADPADPFHPRSPPSFPSHVHTRPRKPRPDSRPLGAQQDNWRPLLRLHLQHGPLWLCVLPSVFAPSPLRPTNLLDPRDVHVFQRLPQRPISTQDPGESRTCLLPRQLLRKSAGGAYCVSPSKSWGIQAVPNSPAVPLTPLLSLLVSGLYFYPH
jgi:hypothetical protein